VSLRDKVGRLVMAPRVQKWIMVLIIFNAVTLGLETSPLIQGSFGSVLSIIDGLVLSVFVTELAAKLIYKGWRFFKDGWNVFDFIVVGIALVPSAGPLTVLRALRILRALRLLSVVPQMRVVIQALLSALPAMTSVVALIALIFYVGAVLATNLFGPQFDGWFGHIGRSMYTLFQIMTLESWSMGIVRPVMEVFPLAWIFFIPFILITSFAVINLFIGIIVDAVQLQRESVDKRQGSGASTIDGKLNLVEKELAEIRKLLNSKEQKSSTGT
tara:strand:- start:30 stop:842 length:813 start_codon:yes stop_codon:yes gene_type:complete